VRREGEGGGRRAEGGGRRDEGGGRKAESGRRKSEHLTPGTVILAKAVSPPPACRGESLRSTRGGLRMGATLTTFRFPAFAGMTIA